QSNSWDMNYLSASTGEFPYFYASGHSNPATGAPRLATGMTTPIFDDSWPDYPRVSCVWLAVEVCTIAYEGNNILTADFIEDNNGITYVGIIMADFPGERLIKRVTNLNPFLTHFGPHTELSYYINLDCGGDGPSWNGTNDDVWFQYIVEDAFKFSFRRYEFNYGPIPNSVCDAGPIRIDLPVDPDGYGFLESVSISVNGGDALWVDRVEAYDEINTLQHVWGGNNSSGWVISTDSTDGQGDSHTYGDTWDCRIFETDGDTDSYCRAAFLAPFYPAAIVPAAPVQPPAPPAPPAGQFYSLDMNVIGDRVTIRLPKSDYLSLAEVQVFDDTGTNVAVGKPTQQTTDSNSALAVDNDTNGNYGSGSVTHTRLDENNRWSVDLGADINIKKIVVWNRTDCCTTRLDTAIVEVSDSAGTVTHCHDPAEKGCALQYAPSHRIRTQRWTDENVDVASSIIGRRDIGWCANQDGSKQREDNAYCQEFGRLYSQTDALEACQTLGMRLPTIDEWYTLRNYVGGKDVAGKYLKNATSWNGSGDSQNFSALAGGYISAGASNVQYQDSKGYWWSDSDSGGTQSRYFRMDSGDDLYHSWTVKESLMSVRCVHHTPVSFNSNVSVALKSHHGKYFDSNGTAKVTAMSSTIQDSGHFTLQANTATNNCIVDGDEVSILGNDGYFRAPSDLQLYSDNENINAESTFTLTNITDSSGCLASGDKVFLRSKSYNKYILVIQSGEVSVPSNSGVIWEKVTVTVNP
ncbi:MAG: hypothetical protein MJK04_13175, partial [Psychrosphaera sp.]|nr:hypothetical protein [Psychrosphaera sp.]